jgi:hypothetical protein
MGYPPSIENLNIIPVSWKDLTPENGKNAPKEWISIIAK